MASNRRESNRRDFLRGGALAAAGLATVRGLAQAEPQHEGHHPAPSDPPPPKAADASKLGYVPVETPDVAKLPWRWVDGAKEFHLRCEVVKQRFLPWRQPFNLWGYNGSVPGPTIEVVEGDRLRFVVDNHLPEETAVHWHGLEVSMLQDGVPGLGVDPIAPGGRYVYEFTVRQNGTFFYHSHFPMQEMMGALGFFIIHPARPHAPLCQRDFGIALQEWAILPNNQTPNTLAMEFNWLTFNGKSGPATTPMLVKKGERVRIRMINLGMDHHPIHLHGNTWWVTGTEGGRIPRSAWKPGNTEIVGVAQARDVEFEARHAGDWMLHCHLPHHMMNHMTTMVGPLTEPGAEHAMSFHPPAPNARTVPGYPQDMFMAMDKAVEKPETLGLRPTWTGAMMGMMTLVRVLEPEMYDRILALKAEAVEPPPASGHEGHSHGGGR